MNYFHCWKFVKKIQVPKYLQLTSEDIMTYIHLQIKNTICSSISNTNSQTLEYDHNKLVTTSKRAIETQTAGAGVETT